MKFSENWLRSLVNPTVSQEELVARLSMAGLEVDGVDPVAEAFSGVVVGEIVAIEQHPDADKLRVCQVSNGSDTFQVVCGAPNARQGIRIPFAMIGAKLPGDFSIKKAKLRGVESNGMLCSAKELGLSDDNAGLMELPCDSPVGKDLRDYLDLNDIVVEVDLTPNRGDCLSLRGIAREVGALYKQPMEELVIDEVQPTADDKVSVDVISSKDCPRYVSRVIKDVDVSKPTPMWMVERLRRSGIRSIDAVVDVTNYVMIELGQPMHAFDLEEIDKGLVVRMAHENETLTLLNGQGITLRSDTLLITDHAKPLAIAGVMGGEHSGISSKTKDLLLEAAFFNTITVAGKARSYGLHTDASHRFERGVDWQLAPLAMERATALLLDIVGGSAGPVVDVVSKSDLPTINHIVLRAERLNKILGIALSDKEVEQLLLPLGLTLQVKSAGIWDVTVPSYRYDIAIEEDLVEEIARLYGYNHLPVRYPQARLAPHANKQEAELNKKTLRDILVARGYQENITYSFIDPKLFKLFNPDQEPLLLANPISSDMSAMRVSLWPGLIKSLQYNINRQQDRVRIFECGLSFKGQLADLKQESMIAGLIMGTRLPQGWANAKDRVDFYDVKGDVEAILGLVGSLEQYQFSPTQHTALHPGQAAAIMREGTPVGYVGALHPELAKILDIDVPVYLFELSLGKIQQGILPAFKELSRFPEVSRDLSVLIDKSVIADKFISTIKAAAGDYLTKIQLFDIYEGSAIGDNQKSIAVRLSWRHPERTLTDDDINIFFQAIIVVLEEQFNATLRK
ncbi:phenylalanine--tRNA ligase subunit beta [Entomomonas moraniae]|uniref:Phenylalanine--tRNA ligase beta subunit n=1 Tax=Entomomonas moraniae TaxID=2213226 RepID=A0A3S9XD35_9GAMM|nr:phenylalanine--tRNA ligase subunit beta [Entomomonas moraniae]AZS50327.1 phenylalanine--tRNA ligase subunit beta [Entomomonas moraniae]